VNQLHRQYPSVEAEAHAALDVGSDDLARRRRRPFDVRLARDGQDDRDEGSDQGERHQRLRRRAQPAERRAQPAERRTAFAPVFDRRHAFEFGAQPVQVPRLPMTRHTRFSHCRRRPARPRLTR
jgi:hypothetical protein